MNVDTTKNLTCAFCTITVEKCRYAAECFSTKLETDNRDRIGFETWGGNSAKGDIKVDNKVDNNARGDINVDNKADNNLGDDTVKHSQLRTRTTPVQHPYNETQFRTTTVPIQDTGEAGCRHDNGHAGRVTLPVRKRLNHRGPLSINVSSAWYFITICADGHAPWIADEVKIGRAVAPRPPEGNAGRAVAPRPPEGNAGRAVAPRPPEGNAGRAVAPRPPSPTTSLETIAPLILREARENHNRGIWWLALFLVMPDHLHFIVNIGGRGATALPRVIANFKHLLSARYGLRFQRDFFDTRLRDDAHFAEEYDYILGNPVRKGLCATPEEWPYSIAFSRADGTETATLVGSRVPRDRADTPPTPCGCAQPIGSRVPRDRAGRAVAPRPPSAEVMSEERKAI